MINLNNGGCSPAPTHVLEQMIRDLRFSNELPVEHMWRTLEPRIESVRLDLAREFGCDPEEMAITRNASEANENVIFGLDLKPGDEIVSTTQNYPRMVNAWLQRERRDKIVFKQIKLPTPPPIGRRGGGGVRGGHHAAHEDDRGDARELADRATSPRCARIVDMARRHNVEVLVDGAHAFAHFPFTRDDAGVRLLRHQPPQVVPGAHRHRASCTCAARGSRTSGRCSPGSPDEDANIRKYEEIGTHPAANHNAISVALAFHRSIGAERKIARLRFLRDRWANRLLAASDRVHMITPIGPDKSGAIGVVAIDGMDFGKLGGWLAAQHHIVTTPMVQPEFQGLRVTPNVYTTLDEIDYFADRMIEAIRKGLA